MEYRILKTKYINWIDKERKNRNVMSIDFNKYTKVMEGWLSDLGGNMYSYFNPLGKMDKLHIYRKFDTDMVNGFNGDDNITYLIYHSWVR